MKDEETRVVKDGDKTIETPWRTKVEANDLIRVLEEYYALSPEDQQKEKNAWVELLNKMMGTREDGKKMVDVELNPNNSRDITFIYE